MAQLPAPEDTFRTHLGADGGMSARMINGLNKAAWAEWQPFQGFPYQEGSGYGNYNDQIVPAPPGQYQTNISIGYGGHVMKTAKKIQGKPQWFLDLVYWWKGNS